jgi:aspartate kinase
MSSNSPIVVQKYGGSSVADVPKLLAVADRVVRTHAAGHRVVVVVSAMGNTTNELLGLARQVSPTPGRRELDMLISVGERITMALLSMAVSDLGVPAVSFTGSQSGIITDENHSAARVIEVRPARIRQALEQDKVVIVAGFQGVSRSREVTTLGRGGSDTTAVALAAALDAAWCEICSDVDGVYSADPRKVPEARHLDRISYEEALALFRAGSKVLNAEATAFAAHHGIVLEAVKTEGGTRTTRVERAWPELPSRVAAVTVDPQLDWVRPGPGGLAELLPFLDEQQVPVRSLRCDGAIVDRRDFHHRHAIRWPEGVHSTPVAVATAAGASCGRLPLLRQGSAALREAGFELLGTEADGDRMAWILEPGREDEAERILHRVLIERA